MAAGLTLNADALPRFAAALEKVARERLEPSHLRRVWDSDGPLDDVPLALDAVETVRSAVWGQGFPPPTFDDTFAVTEQRRVGERHVRLRLARISAPGRTLEAIAFGVQEPLPPLIHAVFRVDVNEYQGLRGVQLVIEHWEARTAAIS
jgi:single-stranded-DNA-specific exonuclease